jgi:hypothetical protein
MQMKSWFHRNTRLISDTWLFGYHQLVVSIWISYPVLCQMYLPVSIDSCDCGVDKYSHRYDPDLSWVIPAQSFLGSGYTKS